MNAKEFIKAAQAGLNASLIMGYNNATSRAMEAALKDLQKRPQAIPSTSFAVQEFVQITIRLMDKDK